MARQRITQSTRLGGDGVAKTKTKTEANTEAKAETNTKRDKLEAQKLGRRFVWQATSFTGYRERHKTQRGNIDLKHIYESINEYMNQSSIY